MIVQSGLLDDYRSIGAVEPALTTEMFTIASVCGGMVIGHTIKPPARRKMDGAYLLPPYQIEYRIGVLHNVLYTQAVRDMRHVLLRRYVADGYVIGDKTRDSGVVTIWRHSLPLACCDEGLRFTVEFYL